ncbi:MAG: hypothetical protein JRG92_18830 [Deltaproteobacteria bacterium]|nr:hypothetical protein [Deltaproteobacteria bacterium]MBW2695450.1 hypothetical protein [Deltaproteobacteria bacterium]
MRNRSRRGLRSILLTAALCCGLAGPAQAEIHWGEIGAGTFDVLVLRPLGALGTVVGFAMFIPAAILSAPGGKDNINSAWDLFVVEPADSAFRRSLGDF